MGQTEQQICGQSSMVSAMRALQAPICLLQILLASYPDKVSTEPVRSAVLGTACSCFTVHLRV